MPRNHGIINVADLLNSAPSNGVFWVFTRTPAILDLWNVYMYFLLQPIQYLPRTRYSSIFQCLLRIWTTRWGIWLAEVHHFQYLAKMSRATSQNISIDPRLTTLLRWMSYCTKRPEKDKLYSGGDLPEAPSLLAELGRRVIAYDSYFG